ncbi:MAG: hypothetical protein DBY32_04100 [Phascolarctobacterium sp.]|nr:MAG: hypothetical protein DBY32_04100 [Phascolarctobacterium sp.]
MSKWSAKFPFDFSPRRGTIHELGQCYVDEIERIYELLNDLRTNNAGDDDPEPFQIKIDDTGKIYIRNADNDEWLLLGSAAKYFGLKEAGFLTKADINFPEEEGGAFGIDITGNAGKIANTAIEVTGSFADNQALVYDANKQKLTNKLVPIVNSETGAISCDTTGNAGKVAGKPIITESLDDGEVLVFRASQGGFVNEPKSNAIGSGKSLVIYFDGRTIADYNGTIYRDLHIMQFTATQPDGVTVTKPLLWLKPTTDGESIAEIYLLQENNSYKLISSPEDSITEVSFSNDELTVKNAKGEEESYKIKRLAGNSVTASTDLNTLTLEGRYQCSESSVAQGLTNCPVSEPFFLDVYRNNKPDATFDNTVQVKQVITTANASEPAVYVRTHINGTWSAWKELANTTWINSNVSSIATNPVKARKIEKEGSTVKLWWSDPDDSIVDGSVLTQWEKTVIVKKQGSYPENVDDGTIVVAVTERNKYADEPYSDTQASPANWYYRAFPKAKNGPYSDNELNRFGFWHYAIYVDTTDPDEETCVHKIGGFDNYFFDRPYMDFDADSFYWGGWKNVQMLPKPCMLKADGSVDYYLDPDDYTKKADGVTASDVTDLEYNGNAMMEWCPVFTKVEKVGTRLYMYFCSEKYDDDYECYSCKKSDGEYGDHFYMPIYEGYVSSGKMRSMSTGTKPTASTTAENEATYATANGTGWNTTVWADEQLLQMLGILFFERLNMQVACGYNPGSSSSALTNNIGTANAKGMFYGHQSTNAVNTKYFGMENWWGHRWRRPNGLMCINRRVWVKLTNSTVDGSTVTGYNRTGNGYIDTGVDVPSASESYIKEISGNEKCVTAPVTVSGASSTTYYCDAAWSATGTTQLFLGGGVADGASAGLFAFHAIIAPSASYWDSGASLSYKSF